MEREAETKASAAVSKKERKYSRWCFGSKKGCGGKEMRIETEGRGERHIQINDFWFQRTDDSRQEGTTRVKIKQLVEPGEDEGQKIRS